MLPILLKDWKTVPVIGHLKQVKTFALSLQTEKPARLLGEFRCADEASAKRMVEEELTPRQKASPETFRFSREKEWLSVQMKVQLDAGKP